jgi:hypothetical protein
MRLKFSDSPSGESSVAPPVFSHVTDFRTAGVVMNVFLLDPSAQLLSAFVWVAGSNTIGLYVLLNWDKNEYVFVDTGIECVSSLSTTVNQIKSSQFRSRHLTGLVSYTNEISSSIVKKATARSNIFIRSISSNPIRNGWPLNWISQSYLMQFPLQKRSVENLFSLP